MRNTFSYYSKNERRDTSIDRANRVTFLGLFMSLMFILYALRLFSMQVTHGKEYRAKSRTNSSQVRTIPSQRGEIFDRNANMPMVINSDSFAIMLNPGEIPQGMYDTVALRLAAYLGVTKLDIDNKVPISLRRAFTDITIRNNVPLTVVSDIAENKTDMPGVSWVSRPVRNYLESGSISHVLGYVGDITQEEINVMYNMGYEKGDIIGKTGVEKQYDSLLRGKSGSISRTIDARGRTLSRAPVVIPPQSGGSLVLTIDMDIQHLAEKTLGERVGSVVVLRPATGEILAMVSYPYFDPNLFNSDSASSQYIKLANNPLKPLLNRAVNAAYPPASTFKIIMSTAMLNEKAFPEAKKIECKGELFYGGRLFRCHIHRPGHGWLDLKNGLAQSCDVYYWILGRDHLGIDRIADYAARFGFGKSCDIDLPSQSQGFVPTAQWKERRYHEKWMGGDTMSSSIGQGYVLATPLQVADMMAMVCNSGKIYRPHVLKEVRDGVTGDVVQEVKPEVLFDAAVNPAVWQTVREDLRYVITNGTPQYPMHNRIAPSAGKTGTAEVAQYKKSWHSWMVAYAPYNAPVEDQVVVATIVEAVNDWEWWSPYATNIILQGIFAHQDYETAATELGFRWLIKNGNHVTSSRTE